MPISIASVFRRATVAAALMAGAMSAISPAAAIDLRRVDGGDPAVTTISLSGTLVQGDLLKLRGFLGTIDQSKPILAELTIPGGNYQEARLVGKFIHEARIRTSVPKAGVCGGVCMLVLLAGRDSVTGDPSFVKYSSSRLMLGSAALNFQDRQYTLQEFHANVAGTQKLFMETQTYLQAVGARPAVLPQFFALLPGEPARELTNEAALDIGIPVFDERTSTLVRPLPVRR